MADQNEAQVLERGDIYFFFRPKTQKATDDKEAVPHQLEAIQRFYVVLHPEDTLFYRLCIVGRKRMPDPDEHEKNWGTIDLVTDNKSELLDALKETYYQTKTKGERFQPDVRACGEGVYGIVSQGRNTYLLYQLELPKQPGDVQKEFKIKAEAVYVISVKNQQQAGTQAAKAAEYPKRLQKQFGDLRFIAVNPVELLNYAGAEMLLIGASDEIDKKTDKPVAASDETIQHADIFNQLKLWKNEHTTKPLLEGKWQ